MAERFEKLEAFTYERSSKQVLEDMLRENRGREPMGLNPSYDEDLWLPSGKMTMKCTRYVDSECVAYSLGKGTAGTTNPVVGCFFCGCAMAKVTGLRPCPLCRIPTALTAFRLPEWLRVYPSTTGGVAGATDREHGIPTLFQGILTASAVTTNVVVPVRLRTGSLIAAGSDAGDKDTVVANRTTLMTANMRNLMSILSTTTNCLTHQDPNYAQESRV